jgi:predicted alpha/beta superfamily hydrolase
MSRSQTKKMCQMELTIVPIGEAITSDPVFLSGNQKSLGDWSPKGVRLKKAPDGSYSFTCLAPENRVVELKITRGSWKRQGIYGAPFEGVPPSNIVFRAAPGLDLRIEVVGWLDQIPVQQDPVQGELLSHRLGKRFGVRSSRRVFVWLPPSYRLSRKRYPVLYMHDGQNLFDPEMSFSVHDWKADEVSGQLIREGKVREFLIVGIANTADRMEEYNLFRPLGKCYSTWLMDGLMPFINRNYRTLTGPEDTAVMGSSMGGLASFQLAWGFPERFSMAGCLSPAFWQSRSRIYSQVKTTTEPLPPVRFYLDAGEMEPPFDQACQNMAGILRERGYRDGEDLLCHIAPEANHSEKAWSERLHIPLLFFFGNKRKKPSSF